MQATEKAGLIKLFQIASLIALKGRSFSDYSSLLDFEKIHGVKFLEKYEHGNSWRELINNTSDYLFNKDAKKKVLRTNFTGVLNDGTQQLKNKKWLMLPSSILTTLNHV